MKYLVGFVSFFLALPVFADFCVLSSGNIENPYEFEIHDRVDHMVSGTVYTLKHNNVLIQVKAVQTFQKAASVFTASTYNRVYNMYDQTYSQGLVEVSKENGIVLPFIEHDYDMTCYAHGSPLK